MRFTPSDTGGNNGAGGTMIVGVGVGSGDVTVGALSAFAVIGRGVAVGSRVAVGRGVIDGVRVGGRSTGAFNETLAGWACIATMAIAATETNSSGISQPIRRRRTRARCMVMRQKHTLVLR